MGEMVPLWIRQAAIRNTLMEKCPTLGWDEAEELAEKMIELATAEMLPRTGEVLKETPQYVHDCEQCVFLGRHEGADLYFCQQTTQSPTVVARRSSEGSDYLSGIHGTKHTPLLAEAARRAVARGLLASAWLHQ